MSSDGESWQSNLESWRERRRAAARAMTLEIQQACPPSPPPSQETTEFANKPVMPPSPSINIKETMRKFKTLEMSPTPDVERRSVPQEDLKSVSSGIVKNSPFLLSDADRGKQIFNCKAETRPPIRIRLVYNSDCVKADNLGLVVDAEGADDGPPFVIRGLVKDSMAERGNLQVGDELLSVDNLCCTHTSDRPLLIKKLAKLHQELQRLTNKQRPVEVKVFREKERDKTKISQTITDRIRTNGISTTTVETKKNASLLNGSFHSRIDENKHLQIGTNGGSGSAILQELQIPQLSNRIEESIPTTEQVELKFADHHSTTPFSPRKDTSSKVPTITGDNKRSDPIVEQVSVPMTETVITRDNSEESMQIYSQRSHQRPTSKIHTNCSSSPIFEPSNLPSPPEPGSSDSLNATPSDYPPSIVTIQPPPTPPPDTGQQSSIASIFAPLPPPPPELPTSLLVDTLNSPYQHKYPEAVMANTSIKPMSNLTPKYAALSTKKTSSSDDLLRSNAETYRRGYFQYDSDINTTEEGKLVKSSTSVGHEWKSEMNIFGGGEFRPKGSSDIDSDDEIPLQQLHRPLMEEEDRISYEEVDTKFPSSIKVKEKTLRFLMQETHNLPQSSIGTEKPEVRTPETVALSPIQVKEDTKIEQTSKNSPMKRIEERENRIHKKLKPASKRIPSDPALRQQNMPSNRQSRVNVIGTWYNCACCNQQLGSSDLMIIEELGLFYHLSCFNCSRCGIQLSDGQNETSVRIKSGKIYCYICYHRLSKSLSRSKDRSKTRKSQEKFEGNSSTSRTPPKLGPHINTTTSYQTSNYLKSIKR